MVCHVPGSLVRVDLAVHFNLYTVEIVVLVLAYRNGRAVQAVLRLLPPGVEVESVVLWRQRQLAGVQLLRLLHHPKELSLPAFGGGFDHQYGIRWDGWNGACDDFLGLVRVSCANLPELGYVQAVDGS